MTARDLIVLGAGPAGASAAIEAAQLGLSVVLLDEGTDAGGHVYRPSSLSTASQDEAGQQLRSALAGSLVERRFGSRVWLAEKGFRVQSLGEDGVQAQAADALIIATGALERHVPIPGWTLPGTMGLAAATILLKSQGVLPGRRVVVAGTGPLLVFVAAAIIRAGGQVAAVVDANPRRAWLEQGRALASRPDLSARGASWLASLLRARVPVLSRSALRRIEGHGEVERVVVGGLDRKDGPSGADARVIACDAVCYGFGLMPATDVTRLMRAAHVFDPLRGGWCPVTDADGCTSVERLYAAGDCAGVVGAAAAPHQGRLAALAAARDLGLLSAAEADNRAIPIRAALRRSARFGAAMTALSAPRPGWTDLIAEEAVVCRCESLTRRDLDAAIASGSDTLSGLKAATRCGMGPCGGRSCEDSVAALIAHAKACSREAVGQGTARPPLRPVPLHRLGGDFDYDALPIPEPAPL